MREAPRTRWEDTKLEEIAACERDLGRARAALTELVEHSRARGVDVGHLDDVGPVSLEIARLRQRGARLADELAAISGEWLA